MVRAGENTSEVSRSGTSAFAGDDAEARGPAERRRTVLALVVSVVLVGVLIGVAAVVIGLVVPDAPDRTADVEATARRDAFLDTLVPMPGVVDLVEPASMVQTGYDARSETIDVTVSGTPAELEEVFAALCEHGGREGDHGADYLFAVTTDAAPMTLQCEDPALAGRLAALVDLARDVPPSAVEGVRIAVSGADVSVWARPAPEALPEAWRWVSPWTTGVLDLGLTPVEVRLATEP